ncbi:MAG TPA: hypothetical protein VFP84_02710 [Kofleriaceae bacterium]|nr:hypothetical protein [Kofleriaceae bacterium]
MATSTGTGPGSGPALADARWFACDLHVGHRAFHVLHVDEAVIERSSFLDSRIEAPLDQAVAVEAAAIGALPQAPIGWLFHTSFCASTLLARVLHLAPHSVALKEPLVLRRLADARHAGLAIDDLIAPAVRLLARPWHPGGAVVIKPTHVALNVAADLLAAAPASRAIVLTCSLDEFLISNLKKPPASQEKIPLLVERALHGTAFAARLPAAALAPPDLICAAGLQWAAQREHVVDVVAAIGAARVRVLDMATLLADLPAVAVDTAGWLGLAIPPPALADHARAEGARNAKATATPYGTERRAFEAGIVVQHFAGPLDHARRWLDRHVLPTMRSAAK